MTDQEFSVFVTRFRSQFLSPDEPFDFVIFWQPKVMPFDADVIERAVLETATDVRILKTPARFYLPIILDYANELTERKRQYFAKIERDREAEEHKAKIRAEMKS